LDAGREKEVVFSVINRNRIKKALPFLARLFSWIKRRKTELRSLPRHIKRKMAQKNNTRINHGIIKVVFLCQYIPAWSKNKQLYEALCRDERFEVMLLCVPNRISANQLRDPDDLSNDTYEYFSDHGYHEAVNALVGKNTWLDLKAHHPDYVICNRYDRPMPLPYTSSEISKYAKICLITYSGVALLRIDQSLFDKSFAANTFCFFAESEGKKKEVLRCNSILCKLKLSHAVCCGIPAVENACMAKGDPCETWDFSNNRFRVIYAPRWTTDPTWGGSSFLKYRNTFFTLADRFSDIAVLIRPHPLMFDHFVNTGLLAAEEVTSYKAQCLSHQNVCIDESKEYHATFWKSSVLICDFSSIIVEYYITEKPIIYLAYDENIEYTEMMRAMLSGCYLVNDEKELIETVEKLLGGRDPLAERRAEVCREYLFGGANEMASENMKQFLLDRYKD
jgi:hypothetical protein